MIRDSVLYDELKKEMIKERISSSVIYRNGEIEYQYFKNVKSESKLFKVNSVTKSVLSILIGIALDKGLIESIKSPITMYFPITDPSKRDITIEHLLTMTPGYDWPEWGEWGGRPFPMINSNDWVNYVLEKNMITEPGVKMIYDSGSSHLLSAILQKATNQKLSDFAEEVLFEPLGIQEYVWHEDSKGINIGGFGLSLKTNDMLKLGILMLQNGKWLNKQIVSSDWVDSSTSKKFHSYDHIGSYGYHWWILLDKNQNSYDPTIYFAMGYGGQFIIVSPLHNLVAVFTSAKYIETSSPLKLFKKYFLLEPNEEH